MKQSILVHERHDRTEKALQSKKYRTVQNRQQYMRMTGYARQDMYEMTEHWQSSHNRMGKAGVTEQTRMTIYGA